MPTGYHFNLFAKGQQKGFSFYPSRGFIFSLKFYTFDLSQFCVKDANGKPFKAEGFKSLE
jgi:hypothetical protein